MHSNKDEHTGFELPRQGNILDEKVPLKLTALVNTVESEAVSFSPQTSISTLRDFGSDTGRSAPNSPIHDIMSSPYGPATGSALDVIIVVPSMTCRHNQTHKTNGAQDIGVTASSDFYVTFPSPLQSTTHGGQSNSSSVAKLQRWSSSFLSNNNTISRSGLNATDEKSIEEMQTVGFDHSVDNSIAAKDSRREASHNKLERAHSITTLPCKNPQRGNIQIQINGRPIPDLEMNFKTNKRSESACKFVNGNGYRPPTQALDMLVEEAILNYGRNLIRYILFNEKKECIATAEAFLYLWSARDSIVVVDIDGTITKSDVRGVFDTVLQDNFKHIHSGVCKFFHDLVNAFDEENQGQIRLFYLTARPISYISQTRKLLVGLSQDHENIRYGLQPGPIMCHRGSLSTVLHSELVAKNVYEFKADVLARQIVLPFVAAIGNSCKHKLGAESFDHQSDRLLRSESDISEVTLNSLDDRLFLAGFGNRVTDVKAYEMAGMDGRDIYIINKESRIQCLGYRDLKQSSIKSSLNVPRYPDNTDPPDFCCGCDIENDISDKAEEERVISQLDVIHNRTISKLELDPTPTALESLPVKKFSSRSKEKIKTAKQTIRAFSLRKSFASFRSQDSLEDIYYYGYDDVELFHAVIERMRGRRE